MMDNANSLHVLNALSKRRIDALTKDVLVKAFQDDGIFDLEGLAEHLLKRLGRDARIEVSEPHRSSFDSLDRLTDPVDACRIVHPVPEIPFIFDNVEYEPEAIRRFNGEALVYIPVFARDGSAVLHLFRESMKSVLSGFFRTRRIESLLVPQDFNIPGLPPPQQTGQPPGTYDPNNPPYAFDCGGTTGIACGQPKSPAGSPPAALHKEPVAPVTYEQIQMFDDADYSGNWFWLRDGFTWTDLTRVSRGGWFGGDWNDAISSLSSTNTWCLYSGHIHMTGSTLALGPYKLVPHLSALGWNDRISSCWNYGQI